MILCEVQYQGIIVDYPLLFQKMVQDYLHTSQEFLTEIVVVHSADKDSIRFHFPKKSGFKGADYLLDQINSRWTYDASNHEFDVLSIVDRPESELIDFDYKRLLELRFKPHKTTYQRG